MMERQFALLVPGNLGAHRECAFICGSPWGPARAHNRSSLGALHLWCSIVGASACELGSLADRARCARRILFHASHDAAAAAVAP